MRISYWCSDVCSSDLLAQGRDALADQHRVGTCLEQGLRPVGGIRSGNNHAGTGGARRAHHPAGCLVHAIQAHLGQRSEEHTSELQSLMRISYAVFCLKKKNAHNISYSSSYFLNDSYFKPVSRLLSLTLLANLNNLATRN